MQHEYKYKVLLKHKSIAYQWEDTWELIHKKPKDSVQDQLTADTYWIKYTVQDRH